MDGSNTGITDSVITRALGEELRRVRDSVGWTRAQLVAEMDADIHVQTLATYEQGVRQCTVVRLVEICRALGVGAPAVLGLALQRAEIDLQMIGVQVDVRALARDDRPELEPIRLWADRRLAATDNAEKAGNADSEAAGVVYLDRAVIQEMAVVFGYTEDQLVRYLTMFTPERAPRR